MDSVLHTFGDYDLLINANSTDVDIVRPIMTGSEYDRYIHITPEDVWMDAGGHVGSFPIRYGDNVSKIYCYEPCPINFELIEKNLKRYPRPNVELVQKALVGTDDETVVLSMSTGKDRSSGSILPYQRRKELYTVAAANIVDELEDKDDITKIKMDIEGAEYECLMAIPIDFLRTIDEIVLEYHFSMLHEVGTGEKFYQLMDHLSMGFSVLEYPSDIKKNWHCVVYGNNLDG